MVSFFKRTRAHFQENKVPFPKEELPSNESAPSTTAIVSQKLAVIPEINTIFSPPPFSEINVDSIDFGDGVASGTNGKVIKGKWKNQEVAIKEISDVKPALVDPSSKIKYNEFHILELLMKLNPSMPNIIETYGYALNKDSIYFVMKYFPLGDLSAHIESKKPLTGKFRHDMALGVIEALEFLHNLKIVHRDIKSKNVLISPEMQPILIDFGFAIQLGDNNQYDVDEKVSVGSPRWMAPEAIKGQSITQAVDVFSYGIVLWELVTRLLPYPDINSPFSIMRKAARGDHNQIPDQCPSHLTTLMQVCWRQEPKERPTAKEVKERLIGLEEEFNQVARLN